LPMSMMLCAPSDIIVPASKSNQVPEPALPITWDSADSPNMFRREPPDLMQLSLHISLHAALGNVPLLLSQSHQTEANDIPESVDTDLYKTAYSRPAKISH
jgi:hypothetical protein